MIPHDKPLSPRDLRTFYVTRQENARRNSASRYGALPGCRMRDEQSRGLRRTGVYTAGRDTKMNIYTLR